MKGSWGAIISNASRASLAFWNGRMRNAMAMIKKDTEELRAKIEKILKLITKMEEREIKNAVENTKAPNRKG